MCMCVCVYVHIRVVVPESILQIMAMGLSTKFYMECRVVMCVFVWPHLDAPKCSTEHHIIHWCRTPFWNRHSLTRNFSIILFSVQFLLVRKNSYRKRVRMLCCSRCATNEAIFWLHFGICVAISGLERNCSFCCSFATADGIFLWNWNSLNFFFPLCSEPRNQNKSEKILN